MKKIFYLLPLFWLLTANLFAQNTDGAIFKGCGADIMRRQHPELNDIQARHDRAAYQDANQQTSAMRSGQVTRTLPVVVHIIHNGGPENIPDAQVQQGIAQLNAAFNATFGTGVNTDIQFCMAQRDPLGQTTTGITRNQSSLTNMELESEDLQLKNINRWAPTCFINIWVVASITSASSGPGVVGYAYLPSAHGLNVDGIVMEAGYFGSSQANTGVLVHEMGHYLGLYHTFEGGCGNNNCLLDGDQVCDTPPDQTTFSSCNPNANSCNTDADDPSLNNPFTSDVPDLGEDYMDYSSLSCFTRFTQGQSDRMNWHITNVRSSLMGCLSCQTPCPAPLAASIITPASAQTIAVGSTVNFSATSSNSNSYTWNINADPAFATTLNASHTFNTVGAFWVKFTAISDDPAFCIDAVDSVLVTVTCNAQAVFSVPPLVVNGIATTFTNSSTNATTYAWVLDNSTVSASTDLTYTFVNTGVYQLCLQASNANCTSTLCTTVYVQQNGGTSTGCDNTFIKSLSNMGGTRPNIFPHPNGDFFATGTRNDSIVIVRFDQGGSALWARAFRFGTEIMVISDMFVDDSGDLIGVAHRENLFLGGLKSTAFRYNLTSNSFLWIKDLTGSAYTQIHALDNSNIVLTGESDASSTQYIKLSKNTGLVSGYNLQGETGDFYSNLHNGTIYGACRRYVGGSDFRTAVFAHNATNGAFLWQNTIISSGNSDTRVYPVRPIIDGNNLLVAASGDLNGFNTYLDGPVELVVAQTSLTGNVNWTKQYIFAGQNRPAATAIVPTATGYYIVGNLYLPSLGNLGYGTVIHTDKQGNVIWAKRLGISGKNITRNIMERNGFLYLTMSSDSYSSNDLLLIKLDTNGNTSTDCEFVQPIDVTVVTLNNTQQTRNYSVVNAGPTPAPVSTVPASTPFESVIYCNTPCPCPVIPFSAGPDTTICLGESVQLQATPGFDAYLWSPAGTLNDPNIANPVATPLATTTYIVDAVMNGTELIVNGDFSQGNTGFTSNYIQGGVGYGHYWVTDNPLLFNAQWHIPVDHSPTADNMMLLVDGSNTGTFPTLWQQSVLVQPNTDYVFQFWGAMAYFASPPKLEITINGTVQNTFTLLGGNAMVGVWQPFSFVINSGAASQFNIVLTDLTTAALGNDFALDDISLHNICHYSDSITITTRTSSAQTLDLGPDVTACTNAVHTFDAGTGFESYLWQDGSTNHSFTAFAAGVYWVTVRDSCGGIQQDTVVVSLAPIPTLDLGADQMICAGDSIQLSYSSNGTFSTFNWSPAGGLSCTVCPSPWASPLATTMYHFVASTADGCTNQDSITIIVKPHAAYTQQISQCQNEPFVFNGHVYTQNGTYTDVLTASNGCDSVVTTQLVFTPLPTRAETITFCIGESVVIGGNTYTQSGTVIDTVAGTVGCDTIKTYTLVAQPLPVRSETITFCPGDSVFIGGHVYAQPGVVVDTLPAPGGCDTIVTYALQYQPPAPSTVTIKCPFNIGVAVIPGTTMTVVNYNLPTATTDCPCPGISLTLTAGLPPGGAFPNGGTTVCYEARDSCGNSASCCFQVFIREELACDVKVNGCIKYELLNITADPGQNYTYRIRVTNNCTNKLIYTAIQLPDGVIAIDPPGLTLFEAESGREYAVNNPNFTPFYSIRFKSLTDSIANGQSEIFRYTLPAQAVPTYIDITSRLATQVYYEAHLNTFNCPVGITPDDGNKPVERDWNNAVDASELRLFPNPTAGELFADLSAWMGEKVQIRVLNVYGQQIAAVSTEATDAPFMLPLPESMTSGLYLVELTAGNDSKQTVRFVLQR